MDVICSKMKPWFVVNYKYINCCAKIIMIVSTFTLCQQWIVSFNITWFTLHKTWLKFFCNYKKTTKKIKSQASPKANTPWQTFTVRTWFYMTRFDESLYHHRCCLFGHNVSLVVRSTVIVTDCFFYPLTRVAIGEQFDFLIDFMKFRECFRF